MNRGQKIIAMLGVCKRRTRDLVDISAGGAEYRSAISEARKILAKENPPKFIEAKRIRKGSWEYEIVDQPRVLQIESGEIERSETNVGN